MNNSFTENVEVAFLYHPPGMQLQPHNVKNLQISCRSAEARELQHLLKEGPKSPTVFVLNEEHIEFFYEFILKNKVLSFNSNNWCIFLICHDKDKLKSLTSGSIISPKVYSVIQNELSSNQVLMELAFTAQELLYKLGLNERKKLSRQQSVAAEAMNAVGVAMAGQYSVDEFMKIILEKSVDVSHADAGFLLLRENLFEEVTEKEGNTRKLRHAGTKFIQKARQLRSQNLRLSPEMLDPSKSDLISIVVNRVCGTSWAEGKSSIELWHNDWLQLDSGHKVPELKFENELLTYSVRSYCAFPLRTPNEEVVGVLILINRKTEPDIDLNSIEDVRRFVVPFNEFDMSLVEAFTAQAGVFIDHNRLYNDLKKVFESFVSASVTAIESRDPSTRGHSERVAALTVAFAEAVNRVHSGPYGNIHFTQSQLYEIKYASLLHDFGKIGVRENVLQKGQKLLPHEMTVIRQRLDNIEYKLRIKCLEAYLQGLMAKNEVPTPEALAKIEQEVISVSAELDGLWQAVASANEPQVLHTDSKLLDFATAKVLIGQEPVPLLTEDEILKLSVKQGSLSPEERREIESHVTHSYRFLAQIPWTSELANVPEIVYGHHERLNGSGYPRKLISDEIPVQARLMAITDIFDALVARDRPYKKAVTYERAFDILSFEVKEGKLDRDLFDIFLEARIADVTRPINNKVA